MKEWLEEMGWTRYGKANWNEIVLDITVLVTVSILIVVTYRGV